MPNFFLCHSDPIVAAHAELSISRAAWLSLSASSCCWPSRTPSHILFPSPIQMKMRIFHTAYRLMACCVLSGYAYAGQGAPQAGAKAEATTTVVPEKIWDQYSQ